MLTDVENRFSSFLSPRILTIDEVKLHGILRYSKSFIEDKMPFVESPVFPSRFKKANSNQAKEKTGGLMPVVILKTIRVSMFTTCCCFIFFLRLLNVSLPLRVYDRSW
jgi:hypothetical protein